MDSDERDRAAEVFWKARMAAEEMSLDDLRECKTKNQGILDAAMKLIEEADAELKRRLSPEDYQAFMDKAAGENQEREAELSRLADAAKRAVPKPKAEM